jgi:succinate dehydrogenase / fumarate reductase flavoprotein subunit
MENYDSKRMELSTRDRVAMANYTEIVEGRGSPNGGVYLDISHKGKDFIIEKIPRMYRQFLDTLMIDISKTPMEVSPTAHYSMGGLLVNPQDHWTGVEGLFAAGEVTGGLHGANRLGGNSLAEILIFGKRAGEFASKRSQDMTEHIRSKAVINDAHDNIDSSIKNGSEVARPLQRDLRNIMWEYGGVVKNESKLQTGLSKIKDLKESSKNLDVRPDSEGYQDLMLAFDLEASIVSSEATLLSALSRKESRGAHQRDDFKEISEKENVNIRIELEKNNELKLSKHKIPKLSKELQNLINDTKNIDDFEGMLLE